MDLYIAPVKLEITGDNSINIQLTTSRHFINPIVPVTTNFKIKYYFCKAKKELPGFEQVFAGCSTDVGSMPYSWYVWSNHAGNTAIQIDFVKDPSLISATALVNSVNKQIEVHLQATGHEPPCIDPLFHPLGSLLLVYIASATGGVLIHASGVKDHEKGHLFTAVSGTGKSTMAKLWHSAGALVINDDRLLLYKLHEKWCMFSTPMVNYAQHALMSQVNNLFLIRQSPRNELLHERGATAMARVMANCIQHLHDKDITKRHLDNIIDLASSINLYDLGFKPDQDIVRLIRNMEHE